MWQGKKTYSFAALAIVAALFLYWHGSLSDEFALAIITASFLAIGFRSALNTLVAKLLLGLVETLKKEKKE